MKRHQPAGLKGKPQGMRALDAFQTHASVVALGEAGEKRGLTRVATQPSQHGERGGADVDESPGTLAEVERRDAETEALVGGVLGHEPSLPESGKDPVRGRVGRSHARATSVVDQSGYCRVNKSRILKVRSSTWSDEPFCDRLRERARVFLETTSGSVIIRPGGRPFAPRSSP
jgi:hypothetical protein